MKQCEVFSKGQCLGCTGLAEAEWIGPEQCGTYKKLSGMSGLELCKRILKGEQQKI
jgi:hypothetical protein